MGDSITYEQPLNEWLRTCLKLEPLFSKSRHLLAHYHRWSHKEALRVLLEIANITERPDLKTKLSKALIDQAKVLRRHEANPEVDQVKLQDILSKLDRHIEYLRSHACRLAQPVRENEFLASIRQHEFHPGGACSYNVPACHLWLTKPSDVRTEALKRWFAEFDELEAIIQCLLTLSRNQCVSGRRTAEQGFYQYNFETDQTVQLVRVTTPVSAQVYPVISLGQKRLTVRFYPLETDGHATQISDDLEFQLAYCAI